MEKIKSILREVKHFFRELKASFIGIVSEVTPWLAPAIPAWLVYMNMTNRLGYPQTIAFIGALAVECLGLSAVHTAVSFWRWNADHKDGRAQFGPAIFAAGFYVVIVLTVNAALDIFPDWPGTKIFAHALLSLLSVDAAIIIAIRAAHNKEQSDREDQNRQRNETRAKNKADKAATGGATAGEGGAGIAPGVAPGVAPNGEDVATSRVKVTRDDFLTAWEGNGHHSIAELAEALGIHPRTAQRWVEKSTKPKAEPIVAEGNEN